MAAEIYTRAAVRPDNTSGAKREESLGELFGDLAQETSTLIRQEVALAKAEMTQKAAETGKNVGMIAAGGAVLYAGFLAILAAIIVGLGEAGMAWWGAALLVGVIVAVVGGVLAWKAIQDLKSANMAPQETVQTLKDDARWAKDQLKPSNGGASNG